MSVNQSRSDKNENTQYRKTTRSASSNQQRGFSGAYGKGSGAGVGGPAPSPSISSNRSLKKSNNNAQGGQSRANISSVHSSDSTNAAIPRGAQNGAHTQPQLQGESFIVRGSKKISKQVEPSSTQRSSRPVPKAPTSQSSSVSPDTAATNTPTKAPGDGTKAFPFQFGTISPGFVNVMQIPARTSSAPPNLDEQKRDQARHDSYRSAPPVPTPSVPKQQLPRKDPGGVDQLNTAEAHPVPKPKKDVQVSPAPSSQSQKPSGLPMTGISMPMPFHQPPVSVPFGGPNQQIQSQGVSASSLQMPMPMQLPMGSAPQVQQQVFVQALQPHPMQPQGIMHQVPSLGFTTQMGQLPPQLGNLGMAIPPQFAQQQGTKFGGHRKTLVKITHPETHQELRFDKLTDAYPGGGSSGPRPQVNASPQSQPFTRSPYTTPYNPSPIYLSTPNPPSLTSSAMQPNSQVPIFSNLVSQGTQKVTVMNPSAPNLPVSKSGTHMHGVLEAPNSEHARDAQNVIFSAPSGTTHVTIKPATGSIRENIPDSLPNSSPAVEKGESTKPSKSSVETSLAHPRRDPEVSTDSSLEQSKSVSESVSKPMATTTPAGAPAAVSVESSVSNSLSPASAAPAEESLPVVANSEPRRKETLSRSNSFNDNQKNCEKKGHGLHQVGGQSTSLSTLPCQPSEQGVSSGSGVPVPSVSCEDVPESTEESQSTIRAASYDASEANADSIAEGTASVSSEISSAGTALGTSSSVNFSRLEDSSLHDEQIKDTSVGAEEEQGEIRIPQQNINTSEVASEHKSSKSMELHEETRHESVPEETTSNVVLTLETAQGGMDEPGSRCTEQERIGADLCRSTSTVVDSKEVEGSYGDKSLSRSDSISSNEIAFPKSGRLDDQSAPAQASGGLNATSKHDGGNVENVGGGGVSAENTDAAGVPQLGSKDKPLIELNRSKSTVSKGKKKRREILQKADAAGTTSDLYMAYKGPEEKKEVLISSESTENISGNIDLKHLAADEPQEDPILSEKDAQGKVEPDDWEDAADISKPKLETSDNGEQVHGDMVHDDKYGTGNMAKKYSRDFLLKFADQFIDLPEGFEVKSDIADVLSNANISSPHLVERDSFSSPGRVFDRLGGAPRLERRGSGLIDDDKWSKQPGSFGSGHLRLDLAFGASAGLRPGQLVNYGVLRNPRGPIQYPGVLASPMQSVGSQGMQRNSVDADRWQRATHFHKGLIPSPQTPLQKMHKAEKKYEVGKVTDEEEAKQRQLKAILNKLTPQNFEKLFEQVKAVNIDNAETLTGVINQIFDKALMEPTFCEMYANFCHHLAGELPDFSEDNEKITFKRLLLNKCQEEFERGEREQEEANKADEEGEIKQSEEEREEKRIKARRRMLGNIRLIGELYKMRMLTERIMHECIKKLLGNYQNPDEEDVEALCKLMSTIGEMIDHPKAKEHMDAYFDRMKSLSNNMKLSSRVRFMLRDSIDLRKNKWQQRRKVEGPKKIEEVHRDAAQERQAQASRLARGPGPNSSVRRGPPMDYSQRGASMLSSPNSQMGSFRGLPAQVRGFGNQDVRFDERQSFEARTLSVPLTQRPVGDDSITLGPQGGLGRGMSVRGPPSLSTAPLAEITPSIGDSRRMTAGLNGYNSLSDRAAYSTRDDTRFMSDRFAGPSAYDLSSAQDRNINFGSRDLRNSERNFDRPHPSSPPTRGQGPVFAQNIPSEKVWPEDRLRDMSVAAIKEFYSARDEKEVALCVKDLNSPSFHPTMISLWVTHSFERKDVDRDLLAKLLVNLTKSQDGILSPIQLVKGFESVLTTLEDAVNDAPKAPEFLARIFARVIVENVVSLDEIGQLIYEGGEEPGSLRESGLAADVLGNTLDIIKKEEGENVLNEIRTSCNLRLETFRPPDPIRSKILETFI
ncbi:eukaryotic translation initiation factor 4G isoform X1 [Ziziphus jujuba]|uniref:Eukaryotic translation initiation factor 4G isoform X1 n=1 Tax=Ziziphus jujuba TaxID=326968 RepID=A0ABM3INN8_ZIZJJ|nr:eukaryotic translation initiation factor 4G isoform X1 [Ziziphus jujuba]